MTTINLSDILEFIGEENYSTIGDLNKKVSGIASIYEANKGNLVFCRKMENSISIIENTDADVIICDSGTDIKDKTLILVERPNLWFTRIMKKFFPLKPQVAVHPTAIINDCVKMGKNVKIGPGCVIGFDGFGYVKNEDGIWEDFPHHGGVVIEDNVEIRANTCIARGALYDTVIGNGTKIDSLVHIGHNARIGKNCYITAKCMIGRSEIGDNVHIAPCSSILPGVNVGDGAFIGMGSVVVRDVEAHTLVYGVPASFVRRINR